MTTGARVIGLDPTSRQIVTTIITEPAYRYGFESETQYRGRSWDDVQADLERGWDKYKLRGKLAWLEIKDAVRDSSGIAQQRT